MENSQDNPEIINLTDSESTDDSEVEVIDLKKRKLDVIDADIVDSSSSPHDSVLIPSPIRLTTIRDLPGSENQGTISLKSLLYHQELSHMWQFNFMIDIPFVMAHIHPLAAPSLKSFFVTGHTASQGDKLKNLRSHIQLCENPTRIQAESVYLQNPYGTHHTKMMILGFNQCTELQIVIHTANLISFDWGNMTQGAWISPRLKKIDALSTHSHTAFQTDLVDYLSQYKLPTTKQLIPVIQTFDFTLVNAVLVGSTPGNYQAGSREYNKWGLNKLWNSLAKLECGGERTDRIQVQVSSIASLGATDTYFTPVFRNVLNGQAPQIGKSAARATTELLPIDLIFPTVQNVRESINGYGSGSSIHFRQSSVASQKQLEYLKPSLCTWKAIKAGRALAAPHIKTYMRVSRDCESIRWILLTSANLSKQAWGNISSKDQNLWIQSFELGVLLHPSAFAGSDSDGDIKQVQFTPVYKRDIFLSGSATINSKKLKLDNRQNISVAIRMPYDLPLVRYNWESGDTPWNAQGTFREPDWRGDVWPPQY